MADEQVKKTQLSRAPRLIIDVTQKIIDGATERDSSHCINADAIRAHLHDVELKSGGTLKFGRIAVDLQTIRFSNLTKRERYTYLTPRSAQVCLVNFDQGVKPEPFRFRLDCGQTTYSGLSMARLATAREHAARRRIEEKKAEIETVENIKKDAKKKYADRAEMRKPLEGGTHSVPEKVGGRPPPVSVGKRRQFGLRSFDR